MWRAEKFSFWIEFYQLFCGPLLNIYHLPSYCPFLHYKKSIILLLNLHGPMNHLLLLKFRWITVIPIHLYLWLFLHHKGRVKQSWRLYGWQSLNFYYLVIYQKKFDNPCLGHWGVSVYGSLAKNPYSSKYA